MEALPGSGQQFTIFYSGSVNVFDRVPAHKVQAIMLLLSDHMSSSNRSVLDCSMDSLMQTQQPQLSKSVVGCAKARCAPPRPPTASMPTTDNTHITQKKQAPTITKRSQAELPFARKASLARFLEKRKDRVQEAMERTEDVSACTDGDVEALGSPCKRMKP